MQKTGSKETHGTTAASARSRRTRRGGEGQPGRTASWTMGRNFHAEAAGLVAALVITPLAALAMESYQLFANGQWLDPIMRFVVGAAIVGIGALVAFLVGYSHLAQRFRARSVSGEGLPILELFMSANEYDDMADEQGRTGRSAADVTDPGEGGSTTAKKGEGSPASDPSSSRGWTRQAWTGRAVRLFAVLRRIVETLALSFVYGYTVFLTFFVIIYVLYKMIGFDDSGPYMLALVVAGAGILAYFGYVSGEALTAKTLSGFLPLFVVSGVGTAGLTSSDKGWWRNNFSELGDRTTPAATLFNVTVMAAGICMLIISYFAIYEMVASHDQYARWSRSIRDLPTNSPARRELARQIRSDKSLHIRHFHRRMLLLLLLLTISCVWIFCVGAFRYTPHPIIHNVFGRTMVIPVAVIVTGLPYFAPQLSRSMYVMGYAMILSCFVTGVCWLRGLTTLTNVEGLFLSCYLLWFIVFTRQAAAIEEDRTLAQLRYEGLREESLARAQTGDGLPLQGPGELDTVQIVSRLQEGGRTEAIGRTGTRAATIMRKPGARRRTGEGAPDASAHERTYGTPERRK